MEVENARESVDTEGTIRGIQAGSNPAARITSRFSHLPSLNPYPDLALLTFKLAFPLFPEPEIQYAPGTDMWLELAAPLKLPVPGSTPSPEISRFTEDELSELEELSRGVPARSTTRSGQKPADIVNLLIIGSRHQVESAFGASGWAGTDSMSKRAFVKTIVAAIERRAYDRSPMSEQLLEGRAPELKLQKTLNSYEKRHHARLWKLDPAWRGQEVWAASATHDISMRFSLKAFKMFHHIEANIDLEREKILADLALAGCVETLGLLERPHAPRQALNATGDPMITDGAIAALRLKDCGGPEGAGQPAWGARMPKSGNKLTRLVRRQVLTFRHDIVRGNVFGGVYEMGLLVHQNFLRGKPRTKVGGLLQTGKSQSYGTSRLVSGTPRLPAGSPEAAAPSSLTRRGRRDSLNRKLAKDVFVDNKGFVHQVSGE